MYLWPDSDVTIMDGFCGAGGSSLGCEAAGVRVKLALNHNEKSLATHAANFPYATHAKVDISQEDPRKYPSTTLAWFSPECTNHSNSKGIKLLNQQQLAFPGWTDREEDPFVERSRMTMWDVAKWTEAKRFQLVFVENVPQVTLWRDYQAWLLEMHKLGYKHKTVYFNSMFAGSFPAPVPQSRDRWYTVFWREGNKAPDLDLRPAAYCPECDRDVHAVQSWLRGKRRGVYNKQYVYACPRCSHIVVPHYTPASALIDWTIPTPKISERKKPLKPLKAKTLNRIAIGLQRYCQNEQVPFLVETSRTYVNGNFARPVTGPAFTQTTGQTVGIAIPPAFLLSYYGNAGYRLLSEPVGTCTSRDRHALVCLPTSGQPEVEDCGFRMLSLPEVKRAMGFPEDYEIVCSSQKEGVRQVGLAVTPAVAHNLVKRGVESLGYSIPDTPLQGVAKSIA